MKSNAQLNQTGGINMATLKEEAKIYEAPKTKNIADLEAVSLDMKMENREGKDKDGKVFKYKVVVGIDGEDYRIPGSVLNTIKTILESKPEVKTIKVSKKGEWLNTTYTVIQLE